MHLYEIGERVETGLLLQREPYPHIAIPTESDRRFVLAKNISETAANIPPGISRPLRLDFADLEVQKEMVVLKRDPAGPRHRRKVPCLVRVHVAAGCGGVAALRANSFSEAPIRKDHDEIGRNYFQFPSAGVHPFCTEEYLSKLKAGVEFVDVLLVLQPGAGFRIHRTGDLKDQTGERASAQLAVRWIGHDLRRGPRILPGLVMRGYDDRVPVVEAPLEELATAAE